MTAQPGGGLAVLRSGPVAPVSGNCIVLSHPPHVGTIPLCRDQCRQHWGADKQPEYSYSPRVVGAGTLLPLRFRYCPIGSLMCWLCLARNWARLCCCPEDGRVKLCVSSDYERAASGIGHRGHRGHRVAEPISADPLTPMPPMRDGLWDTERALESSAGKRLTDKRQAVVGLVIDHGTDVGRLLVRQPRARIVAGHCRTETIARLD